MKKERPFRPALSLLLSFLMLFSVTSISAAAETPNLGTNSEIEALKLINKERMKADLDPLATTAALQNAAHTRAKEIEKKFSKTRPDNTESYTVLGENSVTYDKAGELRAQDQSSADGTVKYWMGQVMNSNVVLDPIYTHTGLKFSNEAAKNCWAELFVSGKDDSFKDAKIIAENLENLTGVKSISELDIILEFNSSSFGTSYIPVIDEMCTGFDASKTGSQTVTVKHKNLTATFTLGVSKPDQKAPTGLKGIAPTAPGATDGRITGTTTAMEYRHKDEIYYTACTSDTIENLTSGTYYVRFRESTTEKAGPEISILVPAAGSESHLSYLNGDNEGTFRPDSKMTRGEVAAMFCNLLDEDAPEGSPDFPDVPADSWYAKAIHTLSSKGIIKGYTDGTFRPESSITRGEFITMAVAFSNKGYQTASLTFSDLPKGAWYYKNIETAFVNKWISGYDDGSFRPENPVFRCEVATITNRMLGRNPDKDFIGSSSSVKSFTDLSKSHWAYFEIIEASTDHSAAVGSATETWQDVMTGNS